MKYILKSLQVIYSIYAFLLFFLIMIVLFPFVILASFAGPVRGGNMIFRICSLWADIWFPLIGIFPRNIYESPLVEGRQQIFVNNHISYLDAALIVKALHIPVRPLGKAEMSKIPIFGFIYKNAIVTVDRTSVTNRYKSVLRLKAFLKKGISIFFFPEGTFNLSGKPLKEFYDGAFRIAIETQTAIRPMLFIDTHDRLNHRSIFSLTPGKCRVVFLKEIPVAGMTMEQMPELKRRVYEVMDVKLREYGASWIQD